MALEPAEGGGIVRVSTRRPGPPSDAAFALQIDFQRGSDNPQRVFQAADAMIRAFQGLDRTLCAAVDSRIEPVMVLEDIEVGSIKVWLANLLRRIDDEALKDLDWRPLVGKYLVRAKYAVIHWTNRSGSDGNISALAHEIRMIAVETDIKHVPDYAPPSILELVQSVRSIDEAKGYLNPGDKMMFMTEDKGPVDFDLAVRWNAEELSELAVKETTKFEDMPLRLIVKRPDYLGNAKWDFRHGKTPISAKVEDTDWLHSFQSRKVDVRPGDALQCKVTIEHRYGFDNELISAEYLITKVESVLVNQLAQGELGIGQ